MKLITSVYYPSVFTCNFRNSGISGSCILELYPVFSWYRSHSPARWSDISTDRSHSRSSGSPSDGPSRRPGSQQRGSPARHTTWTETCSMRSEVSLTRFSCRTSTLDFWSLNRALGCVIELGDSWIYRRSERLILLFECIVARPTNDSKLVHSPHRCKKNKLKANPRLTVAIVSHTAADLSFICRCILVSSWLQLIRMPLNLCEAIRGMI